MDSYNYQSTLKRIWEAARSKYETGLREPDDQDDPSRLVEWVITRQGAELTS